MKLFCANNHGKNLPKICHWPLGDASGAPNLGPPTTWSMTVKFRLFQFSQHCQVESNSIGCLCENSDLWETFFYLHTKAERRESLTL